MNQKHIAIEGLQFFCFSSFGTIHMAADGLHTPRHREVLLGQDRSLAFGEKKRRTNRFETLGFYFFTNVCLRVWH